MSESLLERITHDLCDYCGIYIAKHNRQWYRPTMNHFGDSEIVSLCNYCNGEKHPTNPERHQTPKLAE